MYLDYYGLEKEAFHISPDPEFLFLSPSHKEALAVILYGIEKRTGFMLITGGVGLGKTTILRSALERVDKERIKIILLFNPIISYTNLVKTIYRELEMDLPSSGDAFDIEEGLHLGLIEQYKNDRTVVLIIDEAQNLPTETLERLRMLSNLETDKEKLIQIILIGQEPELDNMLDSVQLRQIKQRIAVRARIVQLTDKESKEYIVHRLRRAGCTGNVPFTDRALKTVVRHSKGIPRTINIVCDNALITGYGYRKKRVAPGIVKEVIRDLQGIPRRALWRWLTIPIAALACIAALLAYFPHLRSYLPSFANPFQNTSVEKAPPVSQQAAPSSFPRVPPQDKTAKPGESPIQPTPASKPRMDAPVPATAQQSVNGASQERRPLPTAAADPALLKPPSRAQPEDESKAADGNQRTGAILPQAPGFTETTLPQKPAPMGSAPETKLPLSSPPKGEEKPAASAANPISPSIPKPALSTSPEPQRPAVQQAAPPQANRSSSQDQSDLIDWVLDNRAKSKRGGN